MTGMIHAAENNHRSQAAGLPAERTQPGGAVSGAGRRQGQKGCAAPRPALRPRGGGILSEEAWQDLKGLNARPCRKELKFGSLGK